MLHSRIIPTTVAAVILLGGAGAVLAGSGGREADGRQEIDAVVNAQTSLSQAIAAAEQKTGGKAVETGLENQDGMMAYEVEIAKGGKLQKVLVALDTGEVIKVMASDADHEEHGEHEED